VPAGGPFGSNRATAATNAFAIGQFHVEMCGGPETRYLLRRNSRKEFTLMVRTAVVSDPAIFRSKVDRN